MASHLFDGITSRVIDTARVRVNILERAADVPATPAERTLVLVHGNVSSALFWQEQMLALPEDLRVIAVDLRGFGDSESARSTPRGACATTATTSPRRLRCSASRRPTSWAGRWAAAS
ncbi:alpha/beta fold hydrolase [Microbacterium sp. NIBRBAC000506063]|uniref:alpha/beta fold hydrolase n=1 Tax=Microbacterium sp. NIBRBAC000506063 TaxID=2734618 RepID=UPI00397FF7EF